MLCENYTKELLGLEDVTVIGVERKENACFVSLEMPRKMHSCPCPTAGSDFMKQFSFFRFNTE